MFIKRSGKLLLVILLLLAAQSFACVCIPPKFTEKFTQSDFVAEAKIIKVYANEGEEEIYRADILIKNLFKGEKLTSIYIEGRSDGKKGSSCSIFIEHNTELIIYARKKNSSLFSFGSCSGYLILNKEGTNPKQTQERELEMLNLLKEKEVNFTSRIWFAKKMGFSHELEKFKGVRLHKGYALYELIFTSNVSVKSIKLIRGFENQIDNELIEILKKADWLSVDMKSEYLTIRDHVPEDSKLLVAFYFYPGQKEEKSFISEYDL